MTVFDLNISIFGKSGQMDCIVCSKSARKAGMAAGAGAGNCSEAADNRVRAKSQANTHTHTHTHTLTHSHALSPSLLFRYSSARVVAPAPVTPGPAQSGGERQMAEIHAIKTVNGFGFELLEVMPDTENGCM